MIEKIRLKELIEKYLSHKLSSVERKQLRESLLHSDDLSVEESLGKVWDGYVAVGGRNEEAYREIGSHLQSLLNEQPKKKILFFRPLLKIASVILLAVAISGVTRYVTQQQTLTQMTRSEMSITTREGERIAMTLPDGSKVSLNAKSSFTYPASFALGKRTVSLAGEAYFEVTRNEQQPFVVMTPHVHIEVLGTSFNVNAYPENEFVETLLVEGMVQLYASNDYTNTLTLLPNQTARYDFHTHKFDRSKADKKMGLGWLQGDLIFRALTLPQVFDELEKYYGLTISTEGAIPSELFIGGFHQESINEVMRNLQVHYSFTYTKQGNELTVRFK